MLVSILLISIFAFLVFLTLLSFLVRYLTNISQWSKRGVYFAKTDSLAAAILRGHVTTVSQDMSVYGQVKERGLQFGGFMECWRPAFLIADLDLMKKLFIEDFSQVSHRRGFDLQKTDPHLHFGLINQDGMKWRELRRTLTPTFTTGRIKRMLAVVQNSLDTFHHQMTQHFVGNLENESSPFLQLDMQILLQKVLYDAASKLMCGVTTDVFQQEHPESSEFGRMCRRIEQEFNGRGVAAINFAVLSPKFARLLGIKVTDSTADSYLSGLVKEVIKHREETGQQGDDFLQILLSSCAARKKERDVTKCLSLENPNPICLEMSEDVIISQCLFFINGTCDMNEALVVWAPYELALSPEIQAKLFEEVNRAVEENDGELNYDVLHQLKYLNMFVSEILRKYPPTTRLERRTSVPYALGKSSLILPKDTYLVMPIYAVHHDETFWPDPEKFDPERFTPEEIAKRHPFAYQPFGNGPRQCIGNRFGLTEGKAIIAHLVRYYQFEPCSKTTIPPVFADAGSLKPANGMWLNVSPRKY